MATITHTPVTLPTLIDFDGVRVRQWPTMALNDVGEPINLARFSDKTVQVFGTFGVGGTVLLEGSINGTNWAPLKTVFNGDISFTSEAIATITEVPAYIRPRISAGDGTTSITILILVR